MNVLGGLRTKVWLPTVGICCRVGPVKINMPPHCKRLYFKSLTYHSAETYPLVWGLECWDIIPASHPLVLDSSFAETDMG